MIVCCSMISANIYIVFQAFSLCVGHEGGVSLIFLKSKPLTVLSWSLMVKALHNKRAVTGFILAISTNR